jgi:hypothetical protein
MRSFRAVYSFYLALAFLSCSSKTSAAVPAPGLSLVGSFSTTAANSQIIAPVGLAYDGMNLIVANSAFNGEFYRFTTEGVLLGVFDPPGIAPRDLAFDGQGFWYEDEFTKNLYRVNNQGVVISSFPSPTPNSGSGIGLDWGNGNLWAVSTQFEPKIMSIDTGGQVVKTFASPDPLTVGLAWDGESLWAGTLHGHFFQLNTDGDVLFSTYVPGITRIQGLASDGDFLYTSDADSDTVFKLIVVPEPSTLSLLLCSAGVAGWTLCRSIVRASTRGGTDRALVTRFTGVRAFRVTTPACRERPSRPASA